MFYRIILLLFLLVSTAAAQAKAPELPRVLLDTKYLALTGKTISVTAGDNLQKKINEALPGDTITLPVGVTFTGNFTLPGNGLVIIRTSVIPPEGTRITPADAANFAKLISPNADPAIKAAGPVGGYRFVGLEICVVAGWPQQNGLVVLGDGEKSLDQLPHDITIDRCYIHGNATGNVTRGITGNCKSLAVIDSYISNVHGVGYDTQAICSWNSPGPFKIVNNCLEASGENIMFGGADAAIQNLVPADIEIRRNTLYKPAAWQAVTPKWLVKNLFELKNARRVIVEGNTLEGCWVDGQTGYAVHLTPRNQDGKNPWATVEDVTFRNNKISRSAAGINILGRDNNNPSQQASRILISNNLWTGIGAASEGGNGRFIQITEAESVVIDHNTALHSGNLISTYGKPCTNFVFTNNIACRPVYGVMGDGAGEGNGVVAIYFPSLTYSNNIVIASDPTALDWLKRNYPTGTTFLTSASQVGFSPDFTVTGPYAGIGADPAAILAAISGGSTPPPPTGPPTITLTIPAGGVEIVIRDKAGNVIGTLKLNP